MTPTINQAEDFLKTRLRFGIQMGLKRINALLYQAGNPHKSFPTILIGGTNGKGSTAAFLTRILKEAGFRVGSYTSPHLVTYRERMAVDGCLIEVEDFSKQLEQSQNIAATVNRNSSMGEATEFEILTLMGLCHFAEQQVDVAVVEVGLGGRLDSTNAINPILSLVTNIDLEHTDRLGNTLLDIAREKFGISRRHVPFITAERKPEICNWFKAECVKKETPLTIVNENSRWQNIRLSNDGIHADFQTCHGIYADLLIGPAGEFQLDNFSCALTAVECLRNQGWRIPDDAIYKGAASTICRGRFETIGNNPTIIADAAHNPAAAQILGRTLSTLFPKQNLILVIGVLNDKNARGILGHLAPLASNIFTAELNSDRGMSAVALADLCKIWDKPVSVVTTPTSALEAALSSANSEDIICVTGSLYMLGELPHYAAI